MLLNLTLHLRYSRVLSICPAPVDCWLLFESGVCGTTDFHWTVSIGLLDEAMGRQQLHSCSPTLGLEVLPQGYASSATSSLEFPWIPSPMKMEFCFHTMYCCSLRWDIASASSTAGPTCPLYITSITKGGSLSNPIILDYFICSDETYHRQQKLRNLPDLHAVIKAN